MADIYAKIRKRLEDDKFIESQGCIVCNNLLEILEKFIQVNLLKL